MFYPLSAVGIGDTPAGGYVLDDCFATSKNDVSLVIHVPTHGLSPQSTPAHANSNVQELEETMDRTHTSPPTIGPVAFGPNGPDNPVSTSAPTPHLIPTCARYRIAASNVTSCATLATNVSPVALPSNTSFEVRTFLQHQLLQ